MICIPLGDCSLRAVGARGHAPLSSLRSVGAHGHAPLSSMQGLLKNLRRASKSADIIEIRADSIRGFSLHHLLRRKINKPLIFTCIRSAPVGARGHASLSSKANCGCFSGTEPERIKLLSSAISSGMFEYVTIDIPESLKITGTIKKLIGLGHRCKTGIILAYHNYQRTPDNLEAIYKKISACKPDVVKIVTHAGQFSDNFKIFNLAQKVASQKLAPKRHGALMAPPKLIAFCMGEKGIISRILYRKFGLFLTYASYKKGLETAEGQIPFEHMKYLYRADGINRRTRIFGLLGNPIAHSYSPVLFNALFKMDKINAVYLPFAVDPGHFKKDLALIKSFLKPAGFSVTSPYKVAAIQSVARLSKAAKEIGAINTIYRSDAHEVRSAPYPKASGRKGSPAPTRRSWVGTNTDWIGVIEALLPLRKLINKRHALILGKGGASRAIVYALRHSGIKTTVFSRNGNKNTVRLNRLPQYCLPAGGAEAPWRPNGAHRHGHGSGKDVIIINATPVGMFPDTGKSPAPKTCLKKGMIVFDTIYNPAETRLLKDARSRGCVAVNGLRMFLAQALRQIEYFIR